jgi:hypothetical protein
MSNDYPAPIILIPLPCTGSTTSTVHRAKPVIASRGVVWYAWYTTNSRLTLIPTHRGDISGALNTILTDPPYGDGVDDAKVSHIPSQLDTLHTQIHPLLTR